MSRSRFLPLLVSLTILAPTVAGAAANLFKDVPTGFVYKAQIDALVEAGVIHGNPDGTFRPNNELTRVELLKLAYLAANRKPKVATAKCASDIEINTWYGDYACDAMANGIMQGDGKKLDPTRAVTRVEALKIIMLVLDIDVEVATDSDKSLVKFADLDVSAWYMNYVVVAYKNGMLPIAGQTGSKFYPGKALLRGEAAAYIVNAQKAKARVQAAAEQEEAAPTPPPPPPAQAGPQPVVKNVNFPFKDTDRFSGKLTTSYMFDIANDTVINVNAAISGNFTSGIICRLYLIDADGYSTEYYLGMQENLSCLINVAVRPGKYQLQLQPTSENPMYTVEAKVGVSDSNDGFKQAIQIYNDKTKIEIMLPNDLVDWFTFTVTGNVAKTATVEVSSTEKLSCIIYTPKDIDQLGFSGPQCDKEYMFEPGTYTVAVARTKGPVSQQLTYSIKWK